MKLPRDIKQLQENKELNERLKKSDPTAISIALIFMIIAIVCYSQWLLYEIWSQYAYSTVPKGFKHIRCQEEEVKTKDCPICLDGSQYVDFLLAPCDHEFHRKCLNKWLLQSSTCPVCREKYDL